MSDRNLDEMSDDEFLNMAPPEKEEPKPAEEDPKQEEKEEETQSGDDNDGTDEQSDSDDDSDDNNPDNPDESGEEGSEPKNEGDNPDEEDEPEKGDKSDPKAEKGAKEPVQKGDKADPKDKTNPEPEKPVNYEEFYKKVMAPFKANGREITLRDPEEAIRLMQMGAGYGRKLQEIQPHLKTLRMLEKNNLLDESKLSYLIDLQHKNPEAIKKLLKDSGIDPLDFNADDPVDYRPSNHSVSDNEVAFNEVINEVKSRPNGVETIRVVNDTWDDTSKNFLWESPQVLEVIQTQRENGIYDQIVAEVDRMKMLGHIPPRTPFIQAYKTAGDALVAAGKVTPPGQTQAPTPQQERKVIETRTAPQKPKADNQRAKAASVTPSAPKSAKVLNNPLELADDEFLKQFNGRI